MNERIGVGDTVVVQYQAKVVVLAADGQTVTVPHPTKEGAQPIVFPREQVALLERALPTALGTLIRVRSWYGDLNSSNLPSSWVALRHENGWRFAIDLSSVYNDDEIIRAAGNNWEVVYDPEDSL